MYTKNIKKRNRGKRDEKKSQWLLSITLFISLGLVACESQSVLSQAYVNTQTTTKTSSNSTTATVSKQAANTGGRPGEGGPGGRRGGR